LGVDIFWRRKWAEFVCLQGMNIASKTSVSNEIPQPLTLLADQKINSRNLCREVVFSLLIPRENRGPWKLLLINDGQDLEGLHLLKHLNKLARQGEVRPTLVVAVCAENRLQEYGVAGNPDYLQRGALAAQYASFVMKELLPYIETHFPVSKDANDRVIAGCSLGGLSAFDIAWNYSAKFGKVGVFSGSFWWRKKALNAGYTDADRIAHHMVRVSKPGRKLEFWFEAGTEDEKSDRNNNGIIDAIDDTLDLITELVLKGYELNKQITYLEVKGGKHDLPTWSKVMPQFLTWALK
jgi:enterochelin esterase-like enzyme